MALSVDIKVEDIEYRKIGNQTLKARMYRPNGPGPFPAIVEVHGGAWISNDRTTNTPIHEDLSKNGVFVMAIDFRMPPDFLYPDSVRDINFAIRWLRKNDKKYNIIGSSIGLLGTSSGGHQAILNALLPYNPFFSDTPSEYQNEGPDVGYVIACWSVLDPSARYQMVLDRGIQRLIDAHHAFWPTVESMEEGNPQKIVEQRIQERLPNILLLQGTKDDNLTPDMAERFFEAYQSVGGNITLEKYPLQPHAFIGKNPKSCASLKALSMITRFAHDEAARVK